MSYISKRRLLHSFPVKPLSLWNTILALYIYQIYKLTQWNNIKYFQFVNKNLSKTALFLKNFITHTYRRNYQSWGDLAEKWNFWLKLGQNKPQYYTENTSYQHSLTSLFPYSTLIPWKGSYPLAYRILRASAKMAFVMSIKPPSFTNL